RARGPRGAADQRRGRAGAGGLRRPDRRGAGDRRPRDIHHARQRRAVRRHQRGLRRMNKGRLEAFSDGVIAIIITIMVLEMKVPHGDRLEDLVPLVPTFLSYVLSFLYVGIYWNNHHHMLHASTVVTAAMMWANLQLLFWLSLFPFATGWMGQNHFTAAPHAVYGVILLMAAI